jgi:hypothetical protein
VKAIARAASVATIICCWIAISNHCAFGAVAAKPEVAQSECPFHSKPAKQKPDRANVQCCKILRATIAKTAKTWTRDDSNFSDVDLAIEPLVLLAETRNVEPLLLDTGPPGKTFFIELIGSSPLRAPPC